MARKQRGIFEKVPSSGVWWIRHADASGRIRREKIGLKAAAITLYRKRKTEVLQGKKLPEARKRVVSFEELSKDALAYSKVHKRDHRMMATAWNDSKASSGIGPPKVSHRKT